jgi:hypothetical protein
MDNPEMIEMMIEMKLTTTNFYTRWPCHVCGGTTEKVNVLCEGHDARLERFPIRLHRNLRRRSSWRIRLA